MQNESQLRSAIPMILQPIDLTCYQQNFSAEYSPNFWSTTSQHYKQVKCSCFNPLSFAEVNNQYALYCFQLFLRRHYWYILPNWQIHQFLLWTTATSGLSIRLQTYMIKGQFLLKWQLFYCPMTISNLPAEINCKSFNNDNIHDNTHF